MKIAFLSTFYPFRGGIAQLNAALYREIEKQHSIKAYTFTRQYPNILFPGETQLITESDEVDRVTAERLLDSINPISYYNTANKILSDNPDLLITTLWMPFFAPSLGYVTGQLQKHNKKTVSLLHNVIPHEKRIGDIALAKYYLNRNDHFIVFTEKVKNDLLGLKPDADVKIKPHPLYTHFGKLISRHEAHQQLGLDPNKKTILFFGFIRPYKGLDLLIEAANNLSDSYQIIIAGEVYGSFDRYQKQIEQTNQQSKFKIFTRYIPDHEVSLFFSAADVNVLPYHSATQSGVVQIAFNFDLPVIATNVGGLKEMLDHNQTGFIIEPNNAKVLSESLTTYFNDNLKDKFSAAIKEKKETWSLKSFAEVFTSF